MLEAGQALAALCQAARGPEQFAAAAETYGPLLSARYGLVAAAVHGLDLLAVPAAAAAAAAARGDSPPRRLDARHARAARHHIADLLAQAAARAPDAPGLDAARARLERDPPPPLALVPAGDRTPPAAPARKRWRGP